MYFISQPKQQGAALLALLLVMISGMSFMLVSKLNANISEREGVEDTYLALNKAKQALIGFALTIPERSVANPRPGPGYLPCPDIDNDGDAEGGCAVNAIGRIPYETLEEDVLRDASGAVLWYALSDNYRNNAAKFTPLNSDTAGQLTLDGLPTDIVAVIIAPGEPIGNQQRTVNPNLVTNYLENDNANGDTSFISFLQNNNPVVFNDKVVAITRQELMAAVEKRVLNEVANTLTNYQTAQNAYPWLSTFASPLASAFRGVVGNSQGHIPFHWSLDPASIAQGGVIAARNPFTTDITLSWNIANAQVTDPGQTSYGSNFGYDFYDGEMTTPDINCIQNSACADGNYAGLSIAAPITFSDASCTWTNSEVFQCTGTFVNTIVNNVPEQAIAGWAFSFNAGTNELIYVNTGNVLVIGDSPGFGWRFNQHTQYAYIETVSRTYTINITFTDTSNDGADIQAPTAAAPRTRDLTVNSADNANALFSTGTTSITLTIDDARQVVVALDGGGTNTLNANSTRTLTNDPDTTGSIVATGLQYDIDIDNGELPAWFVQNNWHDLIYLAYPVSEPLPGIVNAAPPGSGPGVCIANNNCLTLTATSNAIAAQVNNNIRALAVVAGQDLTPAPGGVARPNANLQDYFDLSNSDAVPLIYDRQLFSNAFNDQIRVIRTTATP